MSMPKKPAHKPLSRWIRILIPSLLVITWIALAGIGGPYFGKIEEVSDSDLSAFLPESSESAKVSELRSQYVTEDTIPAILVFKGESASNITPEQIEAVNGVVEKLTTLPGVGDETSPVTVSDDSKAALVVVPLETNGAVDESVKEIRQELTDVDLLGLNHWVSGPGGFLADLSTAFAGIDGILLLVALGVVFVILLLVYRSPLLPFLVLFVALSALAASILLVWWLAKADIVQLNGQVQGILFILVIGAATDYSLLFVARYREELYHQQDRFRALASAWKGTLEPILASGGTVIVGLLCLLISDLGSNKALGPVGAIGIGFAMAAALTFLPALLALVGRAAFWPKIPKASDAEALKHDEALKRGLWQRVGDFVSRHPRPIWITTVVILALASVYATQLKADGVPQDQIVVGYSEARDGQKVLSQHFPDGSGSPAQIIASVSKQDEIVAALEADKGVDTVSIAAKESVSGFKPLGRQEASIKQEIREGIEPELASQRAQVEQQARAIESTAGPFAAEAFRSQVLANIPSVDELVDNAYPFKDDVPTVVNDQILLSATLANEPYSDEAEATIVRLRDSLERIDPSLIVGGTTATTLDTVQASLRDRTVIIPLVLLAITLILMVLLRSILAPILLLLTTVLSFGATLGIAAFVFNDLFGFVGADPTVVLFGFVFLVALGIDYNIFLMTRVREESLKIGTRDGVIKGLVVTGGVITSAGIVLAATFAALAVIPILFLFQIAFIVAFGVLLDTIVVRSLLVPALIKDLGPIVWWPSKLWREKK